MAIIEIDFDAACITADELMQCLEGGEILAATAILNRRWEDYSAADLLEKCAIPNVKMECLHDDTAGSLILTVNYAELTSGILVKRFKQHISIANYKVCNHLFLRYFA